MECSDGLEVGAEVLQFSHPPVKEGPKEQPGLVPQVWMLDTGWPAQQLLAAVQQQQAGSGVGEGGVGKGVGVEYGAHGAVPGHTTLSPKQTPDVSLTATEQQ